MTSSCWSQLTLQVTVSLELGYPAQLARPAPTSRDNTSVELCDPALCTGRDYSLDLEFDSSPEPSNLEWVIRWVPGSSSGPSPSSLHQEQRPPGLRDPARGGEAPRLQSGAAAECAGLATPGQVRRVTRDTWCCVTS